MPKIIYLLLCSIAMGGNEPSTENNLGKFATEIKEDLDEINRKLTKLEDMLEVSSKTDSNLLLFKASIGLSIAVLGYSLLATALTVICQHIPANLQSYDVYIIVFIAILFILVGMYTFVCYVHKFKKS